MKINKEIRRRSRQMLRASFTDGQLDNEGRRRFGRVTLWLMLAIVILLTAGLAALAVHLRVGVPPANSTQIAEVARAAAGQCGLFAAFQLTTAVLLLAAASSSFQAGPGLLKALAGGGGGGVGVLPSWLGRTNQHHTPYWGVVVFLAVSATIVVGAGSREQRLVLFYAVAVFVAFLCGLLAMVRFFRDEGRRVLLATSALGALAVTVTLAVNLARVYPVVSLLAACSLAGALYRLWVRAGRPSGVAEAERLAEASLGEGASR